MITDSCIPEGLDYCKGKGKFITKWLKLVDVFLTGCAYSKGEENKCIGSQEAGTKRRYDGDQARGHQEARGTVCGTEKWLDGFLVRAGCRQNLLAEYEVIAGRILSVICRENVLRKSPVEIGWGEVPDSRRQSFLIQPSTTECV